MQRGFDAIVGGAEDSPPGEALMCERLIGLVLAAAQTVDAETIEYGLGLLRRKQDEVEAFALLSGWQEYRSPEGKLYYHNSHTGVTQWEKPSGGVSANFGAAKARVADTLSSLSSAPQPAVPAVRAASMEVKPRRLSVKEKKKELEVLRAENAQLKERLDKLRSELTEIVAISDNPLLRQKRLLQILARGI